MTVSHRIFWQDCFAPPRPLRPGHLPPPPCSPRYLRRCDALCTPHRGSDSSPVSERPRTTVSVGALHPGLTRGGISVPPTVTYLPYRVSRLNTYGRRAISVAGPMACNSLPDCIRDPTSSTDCFWRLLKTYLFARYQCIQRIRDS